VRENMSLLFDWFERGLIHPRLGATYRLEQFQQAMADVLDRRAIGRIAVVME
jgi:NADPH:quinone reductase-like Zn-dependent oxidoreductase